MAADTEPKRHHAPPLSEVLAFAVFWATLRARWAPSIRRRRSPSSVIHSNSQPCRAQRALKRASSQSSGSTVILPRIPFAFVAFSPQDDMSSSTFSFGGALSPVGVTTARKPQRRFGSLSHIHPPRSPSVVNTNCAALIGIFTVCQLSPWPDPLKYSSGSKEDGSKTSKTSETDSSDEGSLTTASCVRSPREARFAASSKVSARFNCQPRRTPACFAGPWEQKVSMVTTPPDSFSSPISSFTALSYFTRHCGNS
mmetsp:Transcript_37648/g.87009  ORF Transcript_37648/g.87009 Transcript_37648/m.87009 type:complete len:254 (+) Transcript_37648:293-1054(+)